MHRHILFGVVAWLLGAATATAGSLLAVSLLGQGITGNSAQLLTQDAVNGELVSEAAKAQPSVPPSASAAAQPTSAPAATSSPMRTSASPTPPPVTPSAAAPVSSGGTRSSSTGSDGTVFISAGGEVVATCQAAGAYLVFWSPQQGYEVGTVTRGPAATARVTFESRVNRVIMVVSCSAGVPSATSYTRSGVDE